MTISHGICRECYVSQTGKLPKKEPKYSGNIKVVCAWCKKTLYEPENRKPIKRWF